MKNILELATKTQVYHNLTQNSELWAKSLEPLFLNYLKDRVSAIRAAAIERIADLCKAFGANWINGFITKLS